MYVLCSARPSTRWLEVSDWPRLQQNEVGGCHSRQTSMVVQYSSNWKYCRWPIVDEFFTFVDCAICVAFQNQCIAWSRSIFVCQRQSLKIEIQTLDVVDVTAKYNSISSMSIFPRSKDKKSETLCLIQPASPLYATLKSCVCRLRVQLTAILDQDFYYKCTCFFFCNTGRLRNAYTCNWCPWIESKPRKVSYSFKIICKKHFIILSHRLSHSYTLSQLHNRYGIDTENKYTHVLPISYTHVGLQYRHCLHIMH